jgi:hypothetical protein
VISIVVPAKRAKRARAGTQTPCLLVLVLRVEAFCNN